jgi:outer membrane protein OmpA-like peptidoglycan-associated protein
LGADGRLIWADLKPGTVQLNATAVGFEPLSGIELSIGEGMQTRRLSMNWLPRSVSVTVKNTKEMPVDAHITLEGDHKKIEVQSGEDGAEQLLLTPGQYTLLVQANADLEMLQQSVIIPPGGAAMALPIQLKPSRIELTTKEVKIHEQVFFAYDRALIDQRSFAVLSEVAATLKLHPEILQVEIQGHTDAKGTEAYNLQLSQQRADAVRDWLIREGIDPARLLAVGYGNTQPLASNATETGRQKNRRVQFEIQQTNASSSP